LGLDRATDPDAIAASADEIRRRIAAAGGDPNHVKIVAVTKTFGPETARAALAAGLHRLGENYAAELVEKAHALAGEDVSWHYLGAIQTNKIGRLAPVTSVFESVTRVKEADAIAVRKPGATILVQVDFTGRPGRNGTPPNEVEEVVERARAFGLAVDGLMTVAPIEPDAARAAFRRVRELADDLGLAECSMGMTQDLEIAVEEGSTMVRVGRALFGERPPKEH
jgi:PLP dependent protein